MNYFECIKCGNSFVYNGSHIPDRCGTFIGIKSIKVDWSLYEQKVATGCGGKIIKITKEVADKKIENIRKNND